METKMKQPADMIRNNMELWLSHQRHQPTNVYTLLESIWLHVSRCMRPTIWLEVHMTRMIDLDISMWGEYIQTSEMDFLLRMLNGGSLCDHSSQNENQNSHSQWCQSHDHLFCIFTNQAYWIKALFPANPSVPPDPGTYSNTTIPFFTSSEIANRKRSTKWAAVGEQHRHTHRYTYRRHTGTQTCIHLVTPP
jgi:hypothetical protein